MKKVIITILSALFLHVAPAHSEEFKLTTPEITYIFAVMSSLIVSAKCDGYVPIRGSAVRIAENNGLRKEILPAIQAAININENVSYDPDDLIPEVTTAVILAENMAGDSYQSDVKTFCEKIGGQAVKLGLLHRDNEEMNR